MSTCSEPCKIGQLCFEGKCIDIFNQCGPVSCETGQSCLYGECYTDLCSDPCPTGLSCLPNHAQKRFGCVNPCNLVKCPCNFTCTLSDGYPVCLQNSRTTYAWVSTPYFYLSLLAAMILYFMAMWSIIYQDMPLWGRITLFIIAVLLVIWLIISYIIVSNKNENES